MRHLRAVPAFRSLLAPLSVVVAAWPAVAAETAPSLAARVRQAGRGGPEWLGYVLPMVPGQGFACCFDRGWRRSPCRLEAQQQSWGSTKDDEVEPEGPAEVAVLLRVAGGRVGRVRSVSAGCPVDPGEVPLRWLEGVSTPESVELLAGLVRPDGKDERLAEGALHALALHAGGEADRALAEVGSSSYPLDLREDAFLWLGSARGRAGSETLTRLLRSEAEAEAREKIVFGLSQSPEPEAHREILRAAETDRDPEVRGESLFWLAQTGAPIAPQGILRAIERDPDAEVREKGVFALSQLPDKQGTLLLIDLIRRPTSPRIRRQALFWLAQSDDPRALDLIEDLLEP